MRIVSFGGPRLGFVPNLIRDRPDGRVPGAGRISSLRIGGERSDCDFLGMKAGVS
jgi:hypothetical protein